VANLWPLLACFDYSAWFVDDTTRFDHQTLIAYMKFNWIEENIAT
jgi:hypothetical protein